MWQRLGDGLIDEATAAAEVDAIECERTRRRQAGAFGEARDEWAAAGIPTFPLDADKRPLVKGYPRTGLSGSAALVPRFADAPGLGFLAQRAGVAVIDIDAPGPDAMRAALGRWGETPAIARTASGGHHLFYRRQAEPRLIRPWGQSLPVDVLGEGVVIAAPTRTAKGAYEWVRGDPQALRDLPPLALDLPRQDRFFDRGGAPVGERNKRLWRSAMEQAPYCGDLFDLLDVVETLNLEGCAEPLDPWEIEKIATSAWGYEQRGENWIGKGGRGRAVADPVTDLDLARTSPDALALLVELRAQWSPYSRFMVANAMAETMQPKAWTRKRFAAARAVLIAQGHLVEVSPATRHTPASYRFRVVDFVHQ